MKIPMYDLSRQYVLIKREIKEAIDRVLRSGKFILGEEVEQFENEVSTFLGVKHAIGVASGTDALYLALKALGIGRGDAVIVPAFTFFATAGAVINAGALPIFADIDPRTFNISASDIEKILNTYKGTYKIRAIIPVHLYGLMADMDEIIAIAKKNNLYVIEDAAQAIGAEYKGHKAGSLGDIGCLSFFPTKNLGAYGDGGMVTTNDDNLAERLQMLRVHGAKPKYYHQLVGINSRLDAIQAAILRVKLKYLPEWIEKRRSNADRYNRLFAEFKSLLLPYQPPKYKHVFHQYTIQIKNRNAFREFLRKKGVETEIYYPIPLNIQPCFQGLVNKRRTLKVSEYISKRVISLPIYSELKEEEQIYLYKSIKEFFINTEN